MTFELVSALRFRFHVVTIFCKNCLVDDITAERIPRVLLIKMNRKVIILRI